MSESEKIKGLIERYQRALSRRSNWEGEWQDCYDYALPMRERFNEEEPGTSHIDRIFDDTAKTSTEEFASRLQAGIVPPFTKWFELKAGSDIAPDDRHELDEQLEAVSEKVWQVISNSNFDEEVTESFYDLAVGTGSLLIEEGDAINPVIFRAVPLPQLVLEEGPFGEPAARYRKRSMRVRDIKLVWPKAKIPDEMLKAEERDEDKKFTVVECVSRNYEAKDTETHTFYVFCTDPKALLFESEFKGLGSNPWVTYRWSKAAGEAYGRGPLFNTLASIRTLNLTVELILENAQMAISGMWQADDDGVINPDTIELVPGTIIPKSSTSNGLQALQTASNFDVGQLIVEQMQHNIKRALFNDSLGDPEGTPMSATEVYQRTADLARKIGSAFGRLHTEMVTRVLQRVIFILQKKGIITLPKVDGKEVKVINVSPLAQAQKHEEVNEVIRFLEFMNGGFGPQMTNTVIKPQETAVYVADRIGVPKRLVNSAAEIQQIANAIAETQQFQQEAMGVAGQAAPQPNAKGMA